MNKQYRILRYLRRRGPALDDFLENRFRVSNQFLAELSSKGFLFASHTGHGVQYEITSDGMNRLHDVRFSRLCLIISIIAALAGAFALFK